MEEKMVTVNDISCSLRWQGETRHAALHGFRLHAATGIRLTGLAACVLERCASLVYTCACYICASTLPVHTGQ